MTIEMQRRAARLAIASAWLVAIAAGAWVLFSRPVALTMPVYVDLAERLRAGAVPASFEPLGYAWLISLMPVRAIGTAVALLHAICFVSMTAGMAWLAARVITTMTSGRAMLGAVIVTAAFVLNPYLLVNLVRVNDNGAGVVVTMIFAVLLYRTQTDGPSRTAWLLGASGILALLMFIRPNTVSLLPLLIVAGWIGGPVPRRWTAPALSLTTMLVAYSLLSFSASGRALFWPGNGAYNLLAGNNPSALHMLREDYNAEASLPAAFEWCGLTGSIRGATSAELLDCTKRFVVESPSGFVELAAYKAYNMMFRPNLRLSTDAVEVAAQFASLFLTAAWWATAVFLAVTRRTGDAYATLLILLFAAPFILTNSDPRFRLPLEPVYAVSLLRMLRVG